MGTQSDMFRKPIWGHAAVVVLVLSSQAISMNTCADEAPMDINAVQFSWRDGDCTTVPFDHGVNHILIEAKGTGGESYTFFVDTGASLTVITPEFREIGRTSIFPDDTAAEAFGASGQVASALQLIKVQNLNIGTLLIKEAAAVVMDLGAYSKEMGTQIHGIVGYNVLSRLTTIIDYQNSTIALARLSSEECNAKYGDPIVSIPFNLRMGALIEVVGHVNEGPATTFIFDIGSRYSGLNQAASKSSEIEFEPLTNQPSFLGLGDQEAGTLSSGMAQSIRVGGLVFNQTRLYSLDLPVFSTLGLGDQNAGLLGNDLLKRYIVAIDYTNKKIIFWNPSD